MAGAVNVDLQGPSPIPPSSSRNLLGTLMPAIREDVGANTGRHVIHTGGQHASYLQLPLQGLGPQRMRSEDGTR
jgi:hypothetical protein